MFNLAVPGSTLRDVSAQTPALLAPRLPDTLLVAAGINDSALPLTGPAAPDDWLTDIAAGLRSLAATALGHNARLVVAGPTWVDEARTRDYEGLRFTQARALALRAFLRKWCEENHVDHLDVWEPLRDNAALLVDGLHPTAEGHQALHRHLQALSS